MNATVYLITPLYSNGTRSMELSCFYFKKLLVKVSVKKDVFLNTLNIVFIIASSADPGEISHYVPFHLGLHCLYCYENN